MSEIIVKEEVLDMEIYSKEDCILNINKSKENLSEWIYKAYKLGEEDFNFVLEETELHPSTVYRYVDYEEAKEFFATTRILNKTENSLSLTQGVYQVLKGKTPQDREQNFQEVYCAIDRLPASYEIQVYNSLKAHAKNGEDLEKVDEILRYIVSASSSVKRKFRSSGSSPYTLKKLLGAIQAEADESVIIGLADTGKLIATKSSKADRQKIKELEAEVFTLQQKIEQLERRNSFLIKTCSPASVTSLLRQLKKETPLVRREKKAFLKACDIMGIDSDVTLGNLQKQYKLKVSESHSDNPENKGKEEEFVNIIAANKIIKKYLKGL